MTDNNPDDRDEPTDDREYGSNSWLSSLLSALESLDSGRTSRSGRRRSDRTVFDYDISIRSGDDLSPDNSPIEQRPFGGRPEDRGSECDRPRKRRVRSSSPSSDHHVATREHGDELLVTADVAGADPEDVTVGFDDATLVVAVEGTELDRIEVPWRERASEAVIKNGVLTVHVRPETADDETDGGDEP